MLNKVEAAAATSNLACRSTTACTKCAPNLKRIHALHAPDAPTPTVT
jgi:hypothetical protein